MSGLPRNWRLSVNNQSGVTINVTVTARLWRYTSAGLKDWTTEQTVCSLTGVLASATAWTPGAAQDNGATPYLGAEFLIAVAPQSSPASVGTVTVQIEHSTDGGTVWPTAGRGRPLRTVVTPSGSTTTLRDAAII